MRYSQNFIPTLKESPADAETPSHQYMIRAGLIRQLAAGIYSVLPLGLRVLRKIEIIIREEMNRIGGLEVFLPSIQPAELWKESGRWNIYGKELLRIRDRHDREFCYGPTHEEVITDMVRREVKSYRQLPLTFYQIQTKFRDEVRPRFGIMRGREFMMKDAYSFHADEASTRKTYEDMAQAYTRIFQRCGLEFKMVEADSGSIGGNFSHEFMVLADSGEDEIGFCDQCNYASNVELAQARPPAPDGPRPPSGKLTEVETPNQKSVEEVSRFLSVSPQQIIKTILFESDRGLVAGLARGDRQINPVKLKNLIGCDWLHPANEKTFEAHPDLPCGFVGPVGLPFKIFADEEVPLISNAVAGANKVDRHLTGVDPARDIKIERVADLRRVVEGDPCPKCGPGKMKVKRGIELGHIFILGTKYSAAMKSHFLDEKGQEHPMVMGCYGIGVGRTAAAAIEQHHDEKGICWPRPLAPFEVQIIPVKMEDEATRTAAENTYLTLTGMGVEVLLDDRNERVGVKFKDADLLGTPLQIIIGPKNLESGQVELKYRKSGKNETHPFPQVLAEIPKFLNNL
ncbi:MAG: proline--tRNA ligase [Nitrospinae bacterium CG11_big_fil_rev_8_21_14_0_20_56_8]|nr:MAG: proline--tRNA ligase [Nitrospinae bacterium CG11_big_fil_rev_8_21_14_0_20_56_8]